MKNIILGLLFSIALGTAAHGQSTPVANERQENHETRIRQGVASGEVTKAEAARLRAEQRHIRRTERRAKSDGEVTARERAKIQRKQNKASRDIRKQKHDIQDRQ